MEIVEGHRQKEQTSPQIKKRPKTASKDKIRQDTNSISKMKTSTKDKNNSSQKSF